MSQCTDGTYDVYKKTYVQKSRRPHRCGACRETIPTGTAYVKIASVYDCRAWTIKRCHRCEKIHVHLVGLCNEANEKYRDDPIWPDEWLNCGETYQGEWGKEPPPQIAALAFALPGEVQP